MVDEGLLEAMPEPEVPLCPLLARDEDTGPLEPPWLDAVSTLDDVTTVPEEDDEELLESVVVGHPSVWNAAATVSKVVHPCARIIGVLGCRLETRGLRGDMAMANRGRALAASRGHLSKTMLSPTEALRTPHNMRRSVLPVFGPPASQNQDQNALERK